MRHSAVALVVLWVSACSGDDGGTGGDTDTSGGSGGTSATTGTTGATEATTGATQTSVTAGTSSGTSGTGGSATDSATSGGSGSDTGTAGGTAGSTGGVTPESACMSYCENLDACNIGNDTVPECVALCLTRLEDAKDAVCEEAILDQLACITGLSCDDIMAWLGGDPAKSPRYPCKRTDVAIGDACY